MAITRQNHVTTHRHAPLVHAAPTRANQTSGTLDTCLLTAAPLTSPPLLPPQHRRKTVLVYLDSGIQTSYS